MVSPLFVHAVARWFERLQPNQGGVLWIAALTTLVIAFDFRKPVSSRNLDLVLLLVLGFLLVDLIDLGAGGLPTDGARSALFGAVFLAIFLVNVALLARAVAGAFSPRENRWTPNLPAPGLAGVAVLLLACNVLLALGREPDDSGFCINRGAARMRTTGRLPYGDAGMGWCGAIYGPLLYAAHVPIQLALPSPGAETTEPASEPRAGTDGRSGDDPAPLATQVALLAFHTLGVVSLGAIGWRLAGRQVGLGLVCLYVGSAYVQGLGGERYLLTGMTHISHIAPTAMTLAAFAVFGRPWLAGTLLGTATGLLFYPAFFFPPWLGYYFWRGTTWRSFAAGFVVVCLVVGAAVWWMTPTTGPGGVLQTLLQSTVGDHEAPSAFSFWGTHPRLAAFWQEPIVDGWYLLKPSALVFAVFVAGGFLLARGRTQPQMALLTAAIAIAVQLWKSHAGGTYVEWYYPFLLIGLFAGTSSAMDRDTGASS